MLTSAGSDELHYLNSIPLQVSAASITQGTQKLGAMVLFHLLISIMKIQMMVKANKSQEGPIL